MEWLTEWKPWAAVGGVIAALAAAWRSLWRVLAAVAMTPYREAETAALRESLDQLTSDYERLAAAHRRLRARCAEPASSNDS